jgi:hypothetical protein
MLIAAKKEVVYHGDPCPMFSFIPVLIHSKMGTLQPEDRGCCHSYGFTLASKFQGNSCHQTSTASCLFWKMDAMERFTYRIDGLEVRSIGLRRSSPQQIDDMERSTSCCTKGRKLPLDETWTTSALRDSACRAIFEYTLLWNFMTSTTLTGRSSRHCQAMVFVSHGNLCSSSMITGASAEASTDEPPSLAPLSVAFPKMYEIE